MRNLVLNLMLFCFFESALSQPVVEIDLAENTPEMTYTFPSAPTTITQFKLLNCLPGKDYKYTIHVNKKVMENKPLSFAEFTGLASDFESVKSAIRGAVAAKTIAAPDT